MWFSSSLDIACACSVFSFAMTVKLLISGRLLTLRSCRASLKSAATSAEGKDIVGKKSATVGTNEENRGAVQELEGLGLRRSRVGKQRERAVFLSMSQCAAVSGFHAGTPK